MLHQRGKVSNCRASKWEIWRNGISKCKLLFVRNYKRCILEQCAMWEKQISGSALETPMLIKYFSQTEHQNIFHCVRTTFGHQRLPFSTKQDLANGWKKLFLETKKTTQQWAMTRSLFANIAFSSNSNQSFVCVRYSIREIFYSSKCTYLPCWGAVLGSSW